MAGATDDKMTRNILLALALGLGLGMILHYTHMEHISAFIKPVGDLFIKFLKMMIIPLVMSSIFVAMVGLGTPKELGSIGVKALIYYFLTTAFAAFIGLVVVNIIEPGVGFDISTNSGEIGTALAAKVNSGADNGLWKTILNVFMDATPTNPFKAMSDSTVLQVIVFFILFGITALFHKKEAEPFVNFMKSVEHLSMSLTQALMKFAPYGVFALMVDVIALKGFDAIFALGKYMITVLVGLLIHFLFLLFLGSFRLKKSPIQILKDLSQPILTAFSTASSAATLPVTMNSVEKNLGVDKKTAQFVLPLGATVNMDGTALYESVAVIFIGQAYGLDLSIANQLIIFMTASLAAIGAAAIPGAGMVTMGIVLTAVGFPLDGIALILAVDRILDMFRTSVNVFGDCVGTAVVDSYIKKE